MLTSYTPAQEVGFSFVVLALVLLVAGVLRRTVPLFRRLHLPAAVIAGFLILAVGPQVSGELTNTNGIFPDSSLSVWRTLPGLLINVVFAAIMIGKHLPSASDLWKASAPHVVFGSLLSFGQFALGGWAVVLVLNPIFDLAPEAGALLEMSFAGGHGTIAGMGQLFADEGVPELVDLGLGLATVSMITGILGGSMLVNWAMRSDDILVARENPISEHDLQDIDDAHTPASDLPAAEGLTSVTFGFTLIGAAIAVGIVLLEALRWLAHLAGSNIFDSFPLFPLTVIGGLVVQYTVTRLGHEYRVDKRSVDGVAAIALDMLVATAIGTMSLATLGHNIPALLIFTLVGFAWSVLVLRYVGPHIHGQNWFEHAIADFGQSQGNVATGFVLADMADPHRTTTAAVDYGYKQLLYEPLLGGGLLTALSVPIIASWGLWPFSLISTGVSIVLVWYGVRRNRRSPGDT